MTAEVKCKGIVIQTLKEKNKVEGGHERYRFVRGDTMLYSENIESLKVNGEFML